MESNLNIGFHINQYNYCDAKPQPDFISQAALLDKIIDVFKDSNDLHYMGPGLEILFNRINRQMLHLFDNQVDSIADFNQKRHTPGVNIDIQNMYNQGTITGDTNYGTKN